MIYLIVGLIGISVTILLLTVMELAPVRDREVRRQLDAVQQARLGAGPPGPVRGRDGRKEAVETALRRVGEALKSSSRARESVRAQLVRAGYRHPDAYAIYRGVVAAVVAGMAGLGLVLSLLFVDAGLAMTLLRVTMWGVFGFLLIRWLLLAQIERPQREIQRCLPDALDLLVVSMELRLNQAIARMADEIRGFSKATGDEFTLVNLEIRAGAGREQALRNLGQRTGVPELRALAGMLIQTDRLGTSIAQALRVHGETSRQKRRQLAEELAAKTTVKLIFPLVFCIFPTLFVVIVGPAVITILRSMAGM